MPATAKRQNARDLCTLCQFVQWASEIARKCRIGSWVQAALLVLYFGNNLQMCPVSTYVKSLRHIGEEGSNRWGSPLYSVRTRYISRFYPAGLA